MQALHSRGWSAAPREGEILAALAVLALTTLLAMGLRDWQPDPAWLFLAAVLVNAVGWGFWIGLSSALLAFLSLNFLFVDPLYTLQVTDLPDVIRLVQFLGTAALTGFLAGRLREEAAAGRDEAADHPRPKHPDVLVTTASMGHRRQPLEFSNPK